MPSAKGPISLPTLSAEVRKTHRPVTTPDRPLTQAETEGYWGRDRGSLLMCEAGKATVIDYYDLLAANLRE